LKLEFFYCLVEDNDGLKGKIKVRVLPDMLGLEETMLPWVRPFLNEASEKSFSLNTPKKGSYIWCLFQDDSFTEEGWYLKEAFLENNFKDTLLSSSFSKIEGLSTQKVNEVHFAHYEDGTIRFSNDTTKEYGILHSSGSYVVILADGSIKANSVAEIELKNQTAALKIDSSGNVEVSAAGLIKLAGEAEHLVTYSQLKSVIDGIKMNMDARIFIDPLSGVTGNVVPSFAADLFDPTSSLNLQAMKATKVKTG
jgi:hypothetical protein